MRLIPTQKTSFRPAYAERPTGLILLSETAKANRAFLVGENAGKHLAFLANAARDIFAHLIGMGDHLLVIAPDARLIYFAPGGGMTHHNLLTLWMDALTMRP